MGGTPCLGGFVIPPSRAIDRIDLSAASGSTTVRASGSAGTSERPCQTARTAAARNGGTMAAAPTAVLHKPASEHGPAVDTCAAVQTHWQRVAEAESSARPRATVSGGGCHDPLEGLIRMTGHDDGAR